MAGCSVLCLHRQLVESYHYARQAYVEGAEAAAGDYPAERAEYVEANPPVTFKAWLIGSRTDREAAA